MNHFEDRESIQRAFREAGLGEYADRVADAAKPCVRIRTERVRDEGELAIGASRFGGSPDVPSGFEWPHFKKKPHGFVGQINLEDLARFSVCRDLPSQGLLLFFFDSEQEAWGFDHMDREGWLVRFVAPGTPLERMAPPQSVPDEVRAKPCRLEFRDGLSIPTLGSSFSWDLELADDEVDPYENLSVDPEWPHQIFGLPRVVQGDMTADGELAPSGLDRFIEWRLLLQVDSDDQMDLMFVDGGMLYFWIPAHDLKESRFDRVWTILQSH